MKNVAGKELMKLHSTGVARALLNLLGIVFLWGACWITHAAPGGDSLKPIKDTPGLARVLLIGDSISIGYTLPVRELLRGRANVHRVPANASSTGHGLKRLKEWLGDGKWDVIHFNFGLHDAKLPPEGMGHSSLKEYEDNLQKIVADLKATDAKLIWATTTPVPNNGDLGPKRKFADVADYNKVASKVMSDNHVPIDDLNGMITPFLRKVQRTNDVHFTAEGSTILARQVVASIEKQLPSVRSP